LGAFEAKTRLSELLRETEKGRSFRITRRGKVVARLIPASGQLVPATDLLAAFRAIRDHVRGPVDVLELVEEGRRF
jgi:prevent-host-death family protein